MTVESESPASSESMRTLARPLTETPAFTALRIRVAEMLVRQAGEVAGRWEAQARTVALRESTGEVLLEYPGIAEVLIRTLAAAVAADGATSADMVPLGLAFGAEAFRAGTSLHHTLKALDLLSAMVLHGVEMAIVKEGAEDLSLADAVRVSRRLQQASSLLSLAAAKGYTQAMSRQMRHYFRRLRHDLRNPLGTIKSVLALLDDETIPSDERANPRFRTMARRNARLLGELIADRLSDSEAVLPVLPCQTVSLRTVACSVRRDLRMEAAARGATVLVAGAKARVRVDAVGLELIMHELLRAALHDASEGEEFSIDFGESTGERAIVCMQSTSARPLITDRVWLERLTALAMQMGARLEMEDHRLLLSLPAQRMETTVMLGKAGSSTLLDDVSVDVLKRLDHGEAGYDVRGTRQRENGQSGSF